MRKVLFSASILSHIKAFHAARRSSKRMDLKSMLD